MTEAQTLAVFSIAATLLGAAIGILGSYFVATRLARNHAQAIAGMRLREAFSTEIVKLQHLPESEFFKIPEILETAFEKHHLAGNEFGFFLVKGEAVSFVKTWRKYCTDENGKKNFEQYMAAPELAIERIKAILRFTMQ